MNSTIKFKWHICFAVGALSLFLGLLSTNSMASDSYERVLDGVLNSVDQQNYIIVVSDTKYSIPQGVSYTLLQTKYGAFFNLKAGMKLRLVVEPDPESGLGNPYYRVKKIIELPENTNIYEG